MLILYFQPLRRWPVSLKHLTYHARLAKRSRCHIIIILNVVNIIIIMIIKVVYAIFGRIQPDVCPTSNFNTPCVATTSFSFVSNRSGNSVKTQNLDLVDNFVIGRALMILNLGATPSKHALLRQILPTSGRTHVQIFQNILK